MDLIYMNSAMEDVGILQDYEFDLAFGSDENNFECKIAAKSHCCGAGFFLYIEGTEYGGIIDGIESDTESQEVKYTGRTWQGLLASKIILPLQSGEESAGNVTLKLSDDSGSLVGKYLVITGDANRCIQYILDRVGLGGLFSAAVESAAQIKAYQFNRFTDVYSGFAKMLKSAGLKLRTTFSGGKVLLSAVPIIDYSQEAELDSDILSFRTKKSYNTVNHLICLGSGELAERMVIHLYADKSGDISQTQTQTGLDEYAAVYDYPNVESEDELLSAGTEELKSMWSQDEIEASLGETVASYDVGDIVGAVDNITGLNTTASITKKIVTIKNGNATISYEMGEK